ncbi:uncharacterized protein LOC116189296 [Punica granatum]|uniref:Uncharacterized protein LOC116189296 n=1 Tax=Punica granatum TaxID=22663 RepID=A0A6P8BV30_PUNGR|nr:uncharacterized protein LOC116189296 [Punica granatum]
MDSSEFRLRKELQGQLPPPLGVCKDSCTIKKPRPPIIIYTTSPKIIHVKPEEFRSLVQRLTGPSKNSARKSRPIEPSNQYCHEDRCGALPHDENDLATGETGQSIDTTGTVPMDPASHNVFSSLSSNTDSVGFLDDFGQEFQGNKGFIDGSFGSTSISSHATFPGQAYMDIFNSFFDL